MADESSSSQPRKKKPPRIWHGQHEKILKDWGEASSCYRHMHYKAYQSNSRWSMGFTLPVIILSTVTGTANFAQSSFPKELIPYVPSVIGAFNLIAAIMTTIAQFLKVTELMESHRVTSIQYGKLARKIRLELTLPISERSQHGDNMVEICRSEYDRLIEQSPPVPKKIITEFDIKFPESNIFSRPELTHIKPIDLFDNEKEDERIQNKCEKIRKDKEKQLQRILPKYQPGKQAIIAELNSLQNQSFVTNRVPPTPSESIASELSELSNLSIVSSRVPPPPLVVDELVPLAIEDDTVIVPLAIEEDDFHDTVIVQIEPTED